ncbi:MAG: hypothetical protein ACKVOU_02345 [Cytophagales bacterium]
MIGFAQSAQEQFGKNRIQYQDFKWNVINTDNFDIYYYPQSKPAAIWAANYAENEYERIADFLGYAPYQRIKLIIYATHSDLIQSNIGLSTQTVFIGGYRVFLKNRVEVSFNSVQTDFQRDITRGIAQMILNEMLFSGTFKEVLQSTYFLSLPEWFLSGLIDYITFGWNVETDDKIRDLFTTKRFKNPNRFTGEDAATIGHSVWNYIIERYGKAQVTNILNDTKSERNHEKAIANLFSTKYKQFLKEWKLYYKEQSDLMADTLAAPPKEQRIIKGTLDETYYGSIKLSPDGTRMAYVQNKGGKYKVLVKNIETGSHYTLYRGGYRSYDQKVNYDLPVVSWRNNDKLGAILVRHDKMRLVTYDIKKEFKSTKERLKLELSNLLYKVYTNKQTYRGIYKHFKQVNDFNFSEDGATIVLSGENVLGQSDIFLYNLRNNNVKPITNDIYDDRHPQFLPKSTKQIVFSSNRLTDSLQPKQKADFRKIQYKYDIFQLHTDSNKVFAKRLTDSPKYNEIQPKLDKEGHIFFLSDENGIYELYKMTGLKGKPQTVTNFRQGILSYDINDESNDLAYLMNINGRRRFFLDTNFNSTISYQNLPKTPRQLMFDNMIYDYKTARELAPSLTNRTPVVTRYELSQSRKKNIPTLDSLDIDIEKYVFEFEKKEFVQRQNLNANRNENLSVGLDTTLANLKAAKRKLIEVKLRFNELYISSPVRYKNDFGLDNLTSTLRVDPLRGTGIQALARMSDIMANHRITAGLFGVFDFRTSIMFLEYEYLKNRIDFRVRYTKDALYWNPGLLIHKYRLQKFEFTTSYPLNPHFRVSATPFFSTTRFINQTYGIVLLSDPEIHTNYLGYNLEFTYDNTRSKGTNMNEGLRFKFGISSQVALNAKNKEFSKLYLDARHYFRIHKDLTWANRFSAGSFVGNGRKNFLLGGMDNWLFASNSQEDANSPIVQAAASPTGDYTDLLFNEYVTNLRGFLYSQLYGNNFLLFNSELRLPIFKYLIRRQIKSNFIRNFQLAVFYDVGTAWTGQAPFGRESSFNTKIYPSDPNNTDPFSAVVTDYRNPFLQGYGFGFRTLVSGYYSKIDVAWGVLDYNTRPISLYLTLGYDF